MSNIWPLSWESVLDHYRSQRFQIVTREQLFLESIEKVMKGSFVPPAPHRFLEGLAEPQTSLWEAFVLGVQSAQDVQESHIFAPLKNLLKKATHVAVIYGEHFNWKSPDSWSYLFEVVDVHDKNARQYIIAHPPATREQIQQAETILELKLPPQYVQLLLATNGLGIELDETSFLCGVGDARAAWYDPQTFQPGAFNRPSFHEIASHWFRWQDIYAYERERDHETGDNTFLSDERICVPFAYTIDDWCFDRSQHDSEGEYPVLFWDHELRQATLFYPDFESWFVDIVIQRRL